MQRGETCNRRSLRAAGRTNFVHNTLYCCTQDGKSDGRARGSRGDRAGVAV
jgi:hypothetical protein